MNRVEQFEKIQKEGLELFKKKNADYGDSFIVYGLIGILIRLQDKINRLVTITNANVSLVKNESLRDTLLDLQNYSTLALMMFDEK